MATPHYAEMASARYMNEEDFATAAPEITPPRRPPVKFSPRTIGTLGIMVCAAALIAGAGTLLFFRNEDFVFSLVRPAPTVSQNGGCYPILRVEGRVAGACDSSAADGNVRATGSTTKSRGACGASKAWTRIAACRNYIWRPLGRGSGRSVQVTDFNNSVPRSLQSY